MLTVAAQDGDEDRKIKAWAGSVPRSRMDSEDLDYSAQIKLIPFVIMCVFGVFYGSIVSHSMSEKMPFVSHSKQSKYYTDN